LTDTKKEKRVEAAKIHFGKIKKDQFCFMMKHQLETRRYYHFAGQPYEGYTIPHGKSLSGHFAAGISYAKRTLLSNFKPTMYKMLEIKF
jgi:hypothetical protein